MRTSKRLPPSTEHNAATTLDGIRRDIALLEDIGVRSLLIDAVWIGDIYNVFEFDCGLVCVGMFFRGIAVLGQVLHLDFSIYCIVIVDNRYRCVRRQYASSTDILEAGVARGDCAPAGSLGYPVSYAVSIASRAVAVARGHPSRSWTEPSFSQGWISPGSSQEAVVLDITEERFVDKRNLSKFNDKLVI